MLQPLRELAGDGGFLKAVSEGLAIFLDEEQMRSYRVPHRFEELVFVGKRFCIKPLLPVIADAGRFFLLTASANRVALFEGSRWELEERQVPGLPPSKAEALNYDEPEEIRQVHPGGPPGPLGVRLAYHGGSGRRDETRTESLEFFRIIDRALNKHLAGQRAPLIFAGVEALFSAFQATCSYRHRVQIPVLGNTDLWNLDQLHAAAWSVASQIFGKERDGALAQCHEFYGTEHVLSELDDVLKACSIGQVDKLLVDMNQSVWGTFDSDSGQVQRDEGPKPGNEDLLDLAVVLAMETGAGVYPAKGSELPHQHCLAAVLRYALTASPLRESVTATQPTV
jgi:hypothetical protein